MNNWKLDPFDEWMCPMCGAVVLYCQSVSYRDTDLCFDCCKEYALMLDGAQVPESERDKGPASWRKK